MGLPVIFDSDGGVDDAAALWWACTSDDIDLVAVTAVGGNVDVDQAAANLQAVLRAAGRPDVPVAMGRPEPVGPVPPLRRAAAIHGTAGLGDMAIPPLPPSPGSAPAADVLAGASDVTIVATGPLGNVARALTADPTLASRVELVIMGGSARAGGNARPAAEANIANDPTAASIVVGANWSNPPLLVGLDVTLRATLTDAEFALVEERRTPAADFMAGPLTFYRDRGSTFAAPGECPCHDLLAMMTIGNPGLVEGPVLPLAVDVGQSAGWGATIVDFRELAFARRGITPAEVGDDDQQGWQRWRIGLEVDVARFRAGVRRLFGDS